MWLIVAVGAIITGSNAPFWPKVGAVSVCTLGSDLDGLLKKGAGRHSLGWMYTEGASGKEICRQGFLKVSLYYLT